MGELMEAAAGEETPMVSAGLTMTETLPTDKGLLRTHSPAVAALYKDCYAPLLSADVVRVAPLQGLYFEQFMIQLSPAGAKEAQLQGKASRGPETAAGSKRKILTLPA